MTISRPPHSFLRRHRIKILLSGTVAAVLLPIISSVLYATDQLVSPPRRKLAGYHHEFLDHPTAHGMRIGSEIHRTNGTPYLVCVPDPSGKLGDRGRTIRRQFKARGMDLPPPGRITGNLVLLHGRTGRKEDYLPVAERLCAMGFRCIIPDLPAHGEHPRNVTTYGVTEAGIPEEVLRDAAEKFRFSPGPAGLLGMSMGGSVAIHAAALPGARWKALVVLCSFDSLAPVIHGQAERHTGAALAPMWAGAIGGLYQYEMGLPLGSIRPARRAAGIRIPSLVAHGCDDRLIPIGAGRRLYEAFPADSGKRWIEVPGAGHNNLLVTDYPIYAEIGGWFLRHVP